MKSQSQGSAAYAPEPEAVDVLTACKVGGISRTMLYGLISSGQLPTVKLGRRRLVRLEALRAFLAGLERAA